MMMDEPLDFNTKPMYTFDTFSDFDSHTMMLDPCVINPAGAIMPDWPEPDLDFNNFINNPVNA